jgi:spermidine/putrescine transport system ATP-binding protein
MAKVRIEGLRKTFGTVIAVQNVSFSLEKGQFLSLLGPSGCGKTTTLRLIAGLEVPDSGSICIDGRDVTLLPPNIRPLNMVFQNYALFPHMTVRRNIEFGMRMQRVPRNELLQRVETSLRMVGLEGFESRFPTQLSGGQQQRVALSRALVTNPEVLLLDEPLSNLDARLRHNMRLELRPLLKEHYVTAIYVTHDQEEAFGLSDRILVMDQGTVLQDGSPEEIYWTPASAYIAHFLGEDNIFQGYIKNILNNTYRVDSPGFGTILATSVIPDLHENELVKFLIRKESIHLYKTQAETNSEDDCVKGIIQESLYIGKAVEYLIRLTDTKHQLRVPEAVSDADTAAVRIKKGSEVIVSWPKESCLIVERGNL